MKVLEFFAVEQGRLRRILSGYSDGVITFRMAYENVYLDEVFTAEVGK